MYPDEQPHGSSILTSDTRSVLRPFSVKEPRRPETVVAEIRYFYRRTRRLSRVSELLDSYR